MKTNTSRGNILLTTVLLLGLVSGLVGITLTVSGTTTRNTGRSRTYAEAHVAADAALEYAYGIWLKRINNKNDKLTTNEANAGLTGTTGNIPTINGFSNAEGDVEVRIDALDEYGVPLASGTAIPKGIIGKVPGYQGWSGQTFTYAAKATVKTGEQTVGVRRLFQYTQVPLFQSMFFFEHDLEFFIPAEMIIKGLIHTNSKAYFHAAAGSMKIQDYVSYVNDYQANDGQAPSGHKWSAPLGSGSNYWPWFLEGSTWVKPGDSKYNTVADAHVHQVARIEPMGSAPENAFQDQSNPNVSGEFHELIEPPVAGYEDPPAISERRLINKAGIIIEVDGTNFNPNATFSSSYDSARKATVYTSANSSVKIVVPSRNGTTLTTTAASAIAKAVSKTQGTPAYTMVTGTIVTTGSTRTGGGWGGGSWTVYTSTSYQYTNFPQSGIYDQRESAWVDTLNVDIDKFKNVIEPTSGTSGVSNFNGVLYVHDNTDRTLNPTTSTKAVNTIRLINGSVLPQTGLTLASQNPVYVQGDYNTGGTGTAVEANKGNLNNDKQPTTVDKNGKPTYEPKPAAIIADAVMFLSNSWQDSRSNSALNSRPASNTTYNMAILAGFMPSTSQKYSGGANNFPRFLENWSNQYCTYWGSMVELFPSKTFTGQWDTGNIYGAPRRCWNFDNRFLTTPPPGSVDAIILTRGPWSRF